MLKHGPKFCFAVIASACIFLLSGTVPAKGNFMAKRRVAEQIKKTIADVRTGATSAIREEAAQHLAQLTRGIDPSEVDDKTVDDLVSLLDLPEGRYWVAVCLGNLGPRARTAIPKLQAMLAQEDCLQVSKSAAGGIRSALAKMGVNPPPPKCGTAGG
jgi:hypothetical protein